MNIVSKKIAEVLDLIYNEMQSEYDEDFASMSQEARDMIFDDYIGNNITEICNKLSTAVFE